MAERATSIPSPTQEHISIWRLIRRGLSAAFKRLFDIFVAVLGMLLLAPLFLYLAWRIRRDSPGPVFFRGLRMGRGEKIFHIIKFRTMYESPESYTGPRVTARDDPRITPQGKWLRDTKLNELPQLWNVLIGEMSLVGPRPEDPEICKSWPPEIRREILSIRPGITSPASVQFRNEEGLLSSKQVMSAYLEYIAPSKLRLDQLYVRHRSFWLDLDTLFWTFMVLLPKLGNYAPPEDMLLLGPVTRLVRRYLSWFMIDSLISFAAMALVGLFWRSIAPLNVGLAKAAAITLGFAVLFNLVAAILGTNRIEWSRARPEDAYDLIAPTLLATLLALTVNYLLPRANLLFSPVTGFPPQTVLPPGMILIASAISLIGFVAARFRLRILSGLTRGWISRSDLSPAQERVLIVGGGESGQFAAWLLGNRQKGKAVSVIGFVDDDLFKQGVRLNGVQVIGKRADIPQLVEQHDIGVLVFAIHNIAESERQEILAICQSTPARLVMVPDILGGFNAILHGLNEVDGEPSELPGSPISAQMVDGWLADLESIAQSGDLELLKTEIKLLRRRLP